MRLPPVSQTTDGLFRVFAPSLLVGQHTRFQPVRTISVVYTYPVGYLQSLFAKVPNISPRAMAADIPTVTATVWCLTWPHISWWEQNTTTPGST